MYTYFIFSVLSVVRFFPYNEFRIEFGLQVVKSRLAVFAIGSHNALYNEITIQDFSIVTLLLFLIPTVSSTIMKMNLDENKVDDYLDPERSQDQCMRISIIPF
jgi:hypothetical protein